MGFSLKCPLESLIRFVVPRRSRGTTLSAYRSFRERGNRVSCPCCKGNFRRFLPYGFYQRANAQCPNCNCLERHRLLWLFLESNTNLFKDTLNMLHFAPESIYEKALKALPNLTYTTADLYCTRAMVKMDLMDIQAADESYDVVFCNHVLEHVSDDRKAMQEIWRVLKPNGWAILMVPLDTNRLSTLEDKSINTPELRRKFYGQDDHLRLYGQDYIQRLKEAGFAAEEIDFAKTLGADRLNHYGIGDGDLIYMCRKPVRIGQNDWNVSNYSDVVTETV